RTGAPVGHLFRRLNLSRALAAAQVAIALFILVAAGLFLRTLSNLQSIEAGFNRESVLTFQINARQVGRGDAETIAFYETLRRRLGAIPGVRAASLSQIPLIGSGTSAATTDLSDGGRVGSRVLDTATGFFETMQIPILLGRAIDERDTAGAPLVAVVNQA